MDLIFEKSSPGRRTHQLPDCDVETIPEERIAEGLLRETDAALPEVSELEAVRHFLALSHRNHAVDRNFYPLGSCTMKYNPKVNEAIAAAPGFTGLHPYVEIFRAQGTLRLLYELERDLSDLTGMSAYTLAPMAGAHGEFVGMSMIRAYHEDRGEGETRRVVLVPDSSHGTNPASAALAGFTVKAVKSNDRGEVDLDDLAAKCDGHTAGIMLTNPNTLGIFETRILDIQKTVHEAGGLLYYDGANLNAIVGKCRPGDMGFDVVHLNLHKTFSTPHGGGGPGAGPVGVSQRLEPFLPIPRIGRARHETPEIEFVWSTDFPKSIGRVSTFFGNVGVCIRAYAYIRSLGLEGLREVAEDAVLAANYVRVKLRDAFPAAYDRTCMHEFVATPDSLKTEHGVRALDVAKRMIDYGVHPPTVYFPLIVEEAMMIEPTETEPKETLDRFAEIMRAIAEEARSEPDLLHAAPTTTPVGRLDETKAARKPRLAFEQGE
jgi:glycine dehydrogenase subunit 2